MARHAWPSCLLPVGWAKTGGYEDLDEFRALFSSIHMLFLLISNCLGERVALGCA